jgi:hypothetical protein
LCYHKTLSKKVKCVPGVEPRSHAVTACVLPFAPDAQSPSIEYYTREREEEKERGMMDKSEIEG